MTVMEHKTIVDQVFQAFLDKLRAEQTLSKVGEAKLTDLLSAKELRPELIKAAIFAVDEVR